MRLSDGVFANKFRVFSVGALVLLGAFTAQGKVRPYVTNKCESLKTEISAMEQAQKVLMENLVATNENMATTLDRYAEDLKSDQSANRSTSAFEVMDVKHSADAFRQHKVREQKLVAQFELKSQELLNKVESCLRR